MAEDLSNYRFDFEKEAGDLHRSLGSAGDNILFVQLDVTPTQATPLSIVGSEELKEQNAAGASAYAASFYRAKPEQSSRAFTLRESEGGPIMGHIIAIRKNESSIRILGEDNQSKMRLWILYHETGHALIHDGPAVDDNHPFLESAADAYAALRFFQRFGGEARDLLSMISWNRAFDTVICDTSRMTSPVLDKIIADSAWRDFSKLNRSETIKLAEAYAKKWTPEAAILTEARPLITQGMNINFPRLAETCLTSPNNFAFYIGAKFFQPFLHPEGIVQDGQTIQISGERREEYISLIKERAGGLGLQDIFGTAVIKSATAPRLIDALKVSRPKSKPFSLNM